MAACLATLMQNELNSDVARFPPTSALSCNKSTVQQIRLLTGLNEGGKTRNNAFQPLLKR